MFYVVQLCDKQDKIFNHIKEIYIYIIALLDLTTKATNTSSAAKRKNYFISIKIYLIFVHAISF